MLQWYTDVCGVLRQVDAKIVFSHITNLEGILARIATYPEDERIEKMKSFYSQLPLHFSFMELAEYSQSVWNWRSGAISLAER